MERSDDIQPMPPAGQLTRPIDAFLLSRGRPPVLTTQGRHHDPADPIGPHDQLPSLLPASYSQPFGMVRADRPVRSLWMKSSQRLACRP